MALSLEDIQAALDMAGIVTPAVLAQALGTAVLVSDAAGIAGIADAPTLGRLLSIGNLATQADAIDAEERVDAAAHTIEVQQYEARRQERAAEKAALQAQIEQAISGS